MNDLEFKRTEYLLNQQIQEALRSKNTMQELEKQLVITKEQCLESLKDTFIKTGKFTHQYHCRGKVSGYLNEASVETLRQKHSNINFKSSTDSRCQPLVKFEVTSEYFGINTKK